MNLDENEDIPANAVKGTRVSSSCFSQTLRKMKPRQQSQSELTYLFKVIPDTMPIVIGEQLNNLRKEVRRLRELCAAVYQMAGCCDAPVQMLDNLSAAASGKPLPHSPEAGLPFVTQNKREIVEEVIGEMLRNGAPRPLVDAIRQKYGIQHYGGAGD